MDHDDRLRVSWIRVGWVCGFLGVIMYLLAAFAPLPDTLSYAAAFSFGPLLAVGAIGLYHCLALYRNSPLLQIAALFAIAGGVTVLIMLSTQQAIFSVTRSTANQLTDSSSKEIYKHIRQGLDSVQLGMDVAWDVLISASTILFGIAMLGNPRFGKIIGSLGILLGGLCLVFNLYYFPTPPADAGSIDWGPFVALWFVAVFVFLVRADRRLT
jgi:hypothetical protein